MFSWFRRWIAEQFGDVYIDPLNFERTFEDDWAHALVERKQRLQFQILKNRGMSLLKGYHPPQPYNSDRIEAQANKAGVMLPTDMKRMREQSAGPSKITPLRTAKK
jgi:hypothetical protein